MNVRENTFVDIAIDIMIITVLLDPGGAAS